MTTNAPPPPGPASGLVAQSLEDEFLLLADAAVADDPAAPATPTWTTMSDDDFLLLADAAIAGTAVGNRRPPVFGAATRTLGPAAAATRPA